LFFVLSLTLIFLMLGVILGVLGIVLIVSCSFFAKFANCWACQVKGVILNPRVPGWRL
jgi:hypothetical protein